MHDNVTKMGRRQSRRPRYARKTFLLVVAALGGCATGGSPAPVESRSTAPPAVAVAAPAAPRGAAPVARSATGIRVFALPDEQGPEVAPAPMQDTLASPGPGTPLPEVRDPVLSELVAQAAVAESRGDLAAARATLERALKVKPREPGLWLRLGELNLAARDYPQALATAQRARELAGADVELKARADELIKRARLASQG